MAHAQYLSYDEYTEYGGSLSRAAFLPLELKSRKRIDRLTGDRIQNMEAVPEAVKQCVLALIGIEGVVGTEVQAKNPVVTAFTTDGYSESYGKSLDADAARTQMNKLVGEYLYGEQDDVGILLLYRGVRG